MTSIPACAVTMAMPAPIIPGQNADLARRHGGFALRAPRTFLGCLFGHEQRSDHRACLRIGHQLCEIFALQPEGSVHRQLAALIDRAQDRERPVQIVACIGMPHGGGAGYRHDEGWVENAHTAGELEVFLVPGLKGRD
ncbi:hypothetical protein [Sphingobium sp. WCS2017Hpa-17]|uniref:hypothetical protein n=1 Tax=Sphingobium sp. WCS2017Hpa-17 TaxID=3073638 RepID=UPI00288A8922|nr:hypothetical protein [Sphingobium sp. WCS2017Hpa-17]